LDQLITLFAITLPGILESAQGRRSLRHIQDIMSIRVTGIGDQILLFHNRSLKKTSRTASLILFLGFQPLYPNRIQKHEDTSEAGVL